MLFSEHYNIQLDENQSWFDPNLRWDTPLFIDPILVFKNNVEGFEEINQKINSFFNIIFKEIAKVKGKPKNTWKKTLNLLNFKETFETSLGYTNFGQNGSGIGQDFAYKIFHSIVDFIDWGLEEFSEYLSPFELFGERIGPDRLSDMLSNIIKEDLIKYTQEICKQNNIPVKKFPIRNALFDKKLGWLRKKVYLPENPLTKKPIILVPKDFLRSETNEMENFVEYLLHVDNEELRSQASSIITENVSKTELRKIVSENKDFFKQALKDYFEDLQKKRLPYDLRNDPKRLGEFKEILEKMRKSLPEISIREKTGECLENFVESIINQFKKCVESNEGYFLLFNDDGKARGERACQTFFWGIADTMCKTLKGPDISPECKTGRGSIDFKFSQGYIKKIHVEIKLARNPKIYKGLEKQLPIYMEAEEIEKGFYVVIKQLGGDNVKAIKLEERYKKMKKKDREKIKIKVIDAYVETKKTASKF